MSITAFHFLRPWWLLLIPAAMAMSWVWRRRFDPYMQWKNIVEERLLKHLIVQPHARLRLRPVDSIAFAMALGGLAVAGPTWERVPPPFGEDQAPMMVAIDLSASMNAIDVEPSRLLRAEQKVLDLLALRSGSRTGLLVYAGTAHLVLPPAEDTELMKLYLPALDPALMPANGRNAVAAFQAADDLLRKENTPGTILLIADGFDTSQIARFAAVTSSSQQQILMLTVGTTEGGPLRGPDGQIQTNSDGVPLRAALDEASLRELARQTGISMASTTVDSSDIEWVQRRAQHHVQIMAEKNGETRWKEFGYYLCFPLALLAALWFRRGWVVRWA